MKQLLLKILRSPTLRYSGAFIALQELLKFYPHEDLIRNTLNFVANCKIEGDYLEFGVYRGNHFIATYKLAEKCGLDQMRFFAFDSFEGLPPVSGEDKFAPPQFKEGEFRCDQETFSKILRTNRINMDRVSITAGWFNETLTNSKREELGLKRAAIVWIDCDFYESTVPCLDFITPLVQDGTVIIFDDWFCFRGSPKYGQQRAFREWLEVNPSIRASEFYKYGWHGNSFILHSYDKPL